MKLLVGGAAIAAVAGFVCLLPLGARPDAPAADDEAIRKMLTDYVVAYNKGDAEAASGYFAPDAEVTDESGAVFKGRDAIRHALNDLFKSGGSVRIEAEVISCRTL